MKICIIILNFNGEKDTLECLCSLQNLSHSNFEILVVDNGSRLNSITEIKKQFPDINYLENKENLGFAEGNNRGIQQSLDQFDALLILNNDTVVDPDILNHFEEAVIKKPKSIFGAVAYRYSDKTKLDHLGGIWNKKTAMFDLVGYKAAIEILPNESFENLDYVCGCALFATTKAFKEIGLFDPRFFLFWEESDFCFRAKKLGYQILICKEAKIWHKVSASFTGGKPHTTYFWWRNRLLWIEKNIPFPDRFFLWVRVLLPAIFKIIRHKYLKRFQLLFIKKNSPNYIRKQQYILIQKAALQGIFDYFRRRFFQGPKWIF